MIANAQVNLVNDNDNDTLRKVQHPSMKAWLYRQECRGHDPAKKESVARMKLALLARCAHTHCTQSVAGMNSQIRNSESTDSEQHNEADRELGKPRKTNTRRGNWQIP